MKTKLLTLAVATSLLLAGCIERTNQTAKEHGSGISIEMSDSYNIHQMSLKKYENGVEVFNENVVYANSDPFEKGDVIWFDVSPDAKDRTVTIDLTYSENLDGTDAQITQKLDISEADKFVHVELKDKMELEIIEMD